MSARPCIANHPSLMAQSAPEAWLKSMGLRDSSPTADKEDTAEAMSLGLYHAQCKDLAQPPTAVRRHLRVLTPRTCALLLTAAGLLARAGGAAALSDVTAGSGVRRRPQGQPAGPAARQPRGPGPRPLTQPWRHGARSARQRQPGRGRGPRAPPTARGREAAEPRPGRLRCGRRLRARARAKPAARRM